MRLGPFAWAQKQRTNKQMSAEVTGHGGVRVTCSSKNQLQTDHTATVAAYICIQLCAGEVPQTHLSVCLFVDKCTLVSGMKTLFESAKLCFIKFLLSTIIMFRTI